MPQVAPFFIIKSQVVPFFIVTWPPNLFSSDTFKGISGPDSDSKLAPNIIDKYTKEILRPLSIGSRFPKLLCGPGVGRRACDTHMDDLTSVEINDEESKQGAKEEIGDLQEVG